MVEQCSIGEDDSVLLLHSPVSVRMTEEMISGLYGIHTLKQGETLNTLSSIAYDDPSHWREIATANGIINPRLLRTGDVLHMPALID